MVDTTQKIVQAETWKVCFLGLGSNLANEQGTPIEHIAQAIKTLRSTATVRAVKSSSLYASKPLGPQDQPDFVNAVIRCETTLKPHGLLELCQRLEQQAGRIRLRHWGERSLDVDVLLYAEKKMATTELTIPHAGLKERNFVLIPLLELEPNLTIDSKPLSDLSASQDWTSLKLLPQDS